MLIDLLMCLSDGESNRHRHRIFRGECYLLEGQESGLNKAKCHCFEKAEEILEVWPGCT